MYFCVRDDDTSFFTSPEELEQAYSRINCDGPVSLAIIPFCVAGTSKGVPEKFRSRWTIHPLHENVSLVSYLRREIVEGRFEAMLHGYYHDERNGMPEFTSAPQLEKKVLDGRKYLEDLLQTRVIVFVPPHNRIGGRGLRAIERAGLHLAGVAGVRSGWPLTSLRTWQTWVRLKRWRYNGGPGVPWLLDLGGHREIPGNSVTPTSCHSKNEAIFDAAISTEGVFCAATHYWELDTPSRLSGELPVGEQLQRLVQRAIQNPRVVWRSLGTIATQAL